jgi:spore germination cell wall hydrolase CwlJ-like protein
MATVTTDREAIALTLWGEARNQGIQGLIAVACVLRNRLQRGTWGHTYVAVCLAPKQFSCWNIHDPNRRLLEALIGQPVTTSILAVCYALADVLVHESIIHHVGAATHYYASSIPPPSWAATGELVATIGQHKFFEKVA